MKYTIMEKDSKISEVTVTSERVEVLNFVTDIFKIPFGKKERPTLKDWGEYLRSRCIPRTRENLSNFLTKVGLKVYRPIDIVEVTHGYMAEDKLWIKFEGETVTWDDVKTFNESL